jgi:hypothetical protein
MYNDEYMMCHEQYMQSVEDDYSVEADYMELLNSTYEIPDNLVQSVWGSQYEKFMNRQYES